MIALTQTISENIREFIRFLKSSDFSKAILIGIAITIPVVIGIALDRLEIGLAICFGAFWSSPSDVSGSYRHKKFGILFSAALVVIVSFIGGYLKLPTLILIPVLGLLSFAIAYISVYGFRASLISFSGLLALVLSFAHDPQQLEVYQYALLIGLGGLWYLLLATIWHRIDPKRQTEEMLTKTYLLTAEFLETRARLVGPQAERKSLRSKLHQLQSQLIDNHENLREILISSRKISGKSGYQDRRLLVFVQLVELLETALANPVNYDKMDSLFIEHPQYVSSFQNLIFEMCRQLRKIAEAGTDERKFPKDKELIDCFEKVKLEISDLKRNSETKNLEGFLMLQNFFEYQEKQFEKLKQIKRLLGNNDIADFELVNLETAKRFVNQQDFDPRLLVRNFSFKSTIFKHSLRLAATVMIGYAVGTLFDFQNPYWILLTIIIILRPSYGLTKTRSKDRIIGTFIGGAIATGVVLTVRDPYLYGALGVTSLVIAFSMVQKNYKTSATFMTLSVIFIYAILRPDVLTVIQYRILDTLIGAILAFLATLWLWPAWEFIDIRQNIQSSVRANKNFFIQIADYYRHKGKVPTEYKITRKKAFLETSNLSSAFQRMVQEPKSKQKGLDEIYELVVLNHSFLSSLASLSIYMQSHRTTDASERFQAAAQKIEHNLGHILNVLSEPKAKKNVVSTEQEHSFEAYLTNFNDTVQKSSERNLQEAHLITEQLEWLFSLTKKMSRLASKVKFDE